MKTNKQTMNEIERLLNDYEIEVEKKREDGVLENNTARTYLIHSRNFVRWCKGEFVPGSRNLHK